MHKLQDPPRSASQKEITHPVQRTTVAQPLQKLVSLFTSVNECATLFLLGTVFAQGLLAKIALFDGSAATVVVITVVLLTPGALLRNHTQFTDERTATV